MKKPHPLRSSKRRRGAVAVALLALGPGLAAGAVQAQQNEVAKPAADQAKRPPAQLAVSPGKMEIYLGSDPVTQSMRLLNLSDTEVPVRVTVAPWDLDDNNQVRILEPDEQSLDQWMVFNPRSFTVQPHSEQTVRFSVRPRVRPADGEHRAMIYFEELQPEDGPPKQVLFKLGSAVYAYAGDVARAGSIDSIDVAADPAFMSAGINITSTGNAHIRMDGQYAVWPLDSFPGVASVALQSDVHGQAFRPEAPMVAAGVLPTVPILGGTERRLMLTGAHSLAPGRYVMAFVGKMAGKQFRDAVEFTVPAAAQGQIAGEQQQQQ